MLSFVSNFSLNNVFNNEPLTTIANASSKEKVAGIAMCCTMITVPLLVYKKFAAKRVQETPSIIASSARIASLVVDHENLEEPIQKTVKLKHSYSETTLVTRSSLVASPFLIRKKRPKKNKLNSHGEANLKEKKLKKACKELSKHCDEIVEYLIDPKLMDSGVDVLNFLLFYVHKVNGTIRNLGIDGLLKIQLSQKVDEILYEHPTKPCSSEDLAFMKYPNQKWKEELADEIDMQNSEIQSILRKRH